MGRRRNKGREVSGWVVLDKPVGFTSTQAVSIVRRLFDAQKAGHAGTLDPLASGCLPIALGEATKAVPQVFDSTKVYRFAVSWGVETDTDDTEGRPVATSENRPDREAILAALPRYVGEIQQVPPAYSAIKIDGERAYDIARDGETPELVARTVMVYRLDLVDMPDRDTAVFETECGKGTYVRAIARDLGRDLGVRGHVKELRRLVVGPFDETRLVPLDTIRAAAEAGGAAACDPFLTPIEAALGALIEIALTPNDAGRVKQGQAVLLRGARAPVSGAAYATGGGQLLAVGEVEAGSFHPKRVFHL
ncbi:MAG: tRNA pseudouridine(55) synthase TruB [Bauldia sp.]|nr:tRNA pseudouridine(55) synthase TruB [Bauldia sp.]